MAELNRRIVLASRPEGWPTEANFRLEEMPLPQPGPGEFLVRCEYLSVDPYMRGRMNDRASYADPVRIGDVMTGEAVGNVAASKNDAYPVGTFVSGMFGWQEFAVSSGQGCRRVDPQVAPISTALHVLGMPGMTAYFCLLESCKAKAGDQVVVSGAAGAVGSIVGQIAKIAGCRVLGIAGSQEKIDWITGELGFDAGLNYRETTDYEAALRQLCPRGVDVYYDNVGGPITDAIFPLLNLYARVGICGQISQYNLAEQEYTPRFLWHLIVKRARIQGFLVFDYFHRAQEALARLVEWVGTGRIKYRETITDGLENAPQAFIGMMRGENIGKQLVRLGSR
jgi:NADPH-dependent curcumin reductase CurA